MTEQTFTYYLDSPVGYLKIITGDFFLLSVDFTDSQGNSTIKIPEIMKHSIQQLQEYFEGTRITFNLNQMPSGTEFQQKIWELVKTVPYGQTASYLDIAKRSGSVKNTRAVGLANGKNPIPIIIPCHRIIGTNGKLTGYAGGIDRKRWLLQHEQKNRVNHGLLF